MKATVVIPMYNFNEMTTECVDIVIKNAGCPHTIIVVDDGSNVPYKNSKVSVLRSDTNRGFTASVNEALKLIETEYVLILNNDTMPEPDFLKILVEEMDNDEQVAICSSARIIKQNDKEHDVYYGIDLIRGHQLASKQPPPFDILNCVWVPFCSVLMRTSVVREIGLLDKRFRNHCSDSEWCFRALINDYRVACSSKSKVRHLLETTTRHNNVDPSTDQRLLLDILGGVKIQSILNTLPLDCSSNLWGRMHFETYKSVRDMSKKQEKVLSEKA